MARKRNLALWVGLGLLAAAIAEELRKPPEEREWHGRIAGFIPYDFRPPTPERLRAAFWNPDEDRVFTGHVFGVGWSINVGRLARLAGVA